jgi:hypothetical protein
MLDTLSSPRGILAVDEAGPIPEAHGMVGCQLVDFAQSIQDGFALRHAAQN